MSTVGIEAINVFGGSARVDVTQLMLHRELDTRRVENLLMVERSVPLPHEDPVSMGVNAAQPILDALDSAQKERIEMLITCSESGIDFGKSMSTYIHHYLGLSRNCRLFEIKQACYSGTAGLQSALSFVLSQASPGAKVLVVATDISRPIVAEDFDPAALKSQEWSYAEPSAGAGAVAMLIGESAEVFQIDVGASGYYGYEVMDTCRPVPDGDVGDADLSLMSYLDCCENAFLEYRKRVADVDYSGSFQYLVFHTPFGGMVKGAHRAMMRKLTGSDRHAIEDDFAARVSPGLDFCQRVGNIMGATVFMALASTIDRGDFHASKRLGCFSYGSGCCSEFFSGVVRPRGQALLRRSRIREHLDGRYRLSMAEYDALLKRNHVVRFGVRDLQLDARNDPVIASLRRERPLLYLAEIRNFHRKYAWI